MRAKTPELSPIVFFRGLKIEAKARRFLTATLTATKVETDELSGRRWNKIVEFG